MRKIRLLIREIKFLATLDGTRVYGKRLLKYVKAMFATIDRQDELTERRIITIPTRRL